MNEKRTQDILDRIAEERRRQVAKWGEQHHSDPAWVCILAEEVGEAAQCVCKTCVGPVNPREVAEFETSLQLEIVQIAAVSVAWLECLEVEKALVSKAIAAANNPHPMTLESLQSAIKNMRNIGSVR